MAEKKDKLFAEFPPISTQEWMQKVTADLKGADFDKKLIWRTQEGFQVKPMYRAEDISQLSTPDMLPGEFPFVRGTKNDNNWLVRQEIKVCKECLDLSNAKSIELLSKGITSLKFRISKQIVSAATIDTLLKGIDLSQVEVHFSTCMNHSIELARIVAEYFKNSGVAADQIKGSFDFDPMGKFITKGKRFDHTVEAYEELIKIFTPYCCFRAISVSADLINNAGSYIYQELGMALSWGNQLMSALTDRGVSAYQVATAIEFNFGISSNYFMEIAKFRAARMLWAYIVAQYKPTCECSDCDCSAEPFCSCACMMHIHATTSTWNMTVYDAHVNLLRTQTEAMSAALAGVDSIEVLPFDKAYKSGDDFSERIARNQQLLLKEESHLDKVVDPSAGSYYIETLTDSLAKEGWRLFLSIEDKGGFWAAAESGFIQDTVNSAGDARRKAIAARKEILLGSNQYPNFNEQAQSKIEDSCCCGCGCDQSASTPTLNRKRGAESFETLRLATEKAAKRPKAFMLTIGSLSMRLARAQFSCNFFGCAGYETVDNLGFDTIEAGVKAALDAHAEFIVLCSSDEEYADIAPAALQLIGDKATLVIAGAPACIEELKTAGINEFINVRSNVLETLQRYNASLGIQ